MKLRYKDIEIGDYITSMCGTIRYHVRDKGDDRISIVRTGREVEQLIMMSESKFNRHGFRRAR